MKKKSIIVLFFGLTYIANSQNLLSPTGPVGIGTIDPQFPFHLHGTTNYVVTTPATIGGGAGSTIDYGKTSRLGFTNSNTGATGTDGTQMRMSNTSFVIENMEDGSINLNTGNADLTLSGSNGRSFFGGATPSTSSIYGRLNILSSADNGLYIRTVAGGYFGLSIKMNANTDNAIQVSGSNSAIKTFLVKANGELNINTDGMIATDKALVISNSSQKILQLENSGLLLARQIKINTDTWPDYVFEQKYNLLPLSKVEEIIKTSGHLPNVPSAETVIKNGIDLGEMNKILMEKVEELTLYLIAQQKEIEALKQTANKNK